MYIRRLSKKQEIAVRDDDTWGKDAISKLLKMQIYLTIAVVKKTFRYSNVFFYNHLYQPSVIKNLFLKSGINPTSMEKNQPAGGHRLILFVD